MQTKWHRNFHPCPLVLGSLQVHPEFLPFQLQHLYWAHIVNLLWGKPSLVLTFVASGVSKRLILLPLARDPIHSLNPSEWASKWGTEIIAKSLMCILKKLDMLRKNLIVFMSIGSIASLITLSLFCLALFLLASVWNPNRKLLCCQICTFPGWCLGESCAVVPAPGPVVPVGVLMSVSVDH